MYSGVRSVLEWVANLFRSSLDPTVNLKNREAMKHLFLEKMMGQFMVRQLIRVSVLHTRCLNLNVRNLLLCVYIV